MCYYVEINLSRSELEKRFGVPALYDPRYMQANIVAAFQNPILPVILQNEPENIRFFQWGLIPSWVKNREMAENIRKSTYNARSEGIFEKPSFRTTVKNKRCLVLVHGFFEWHERNSSKYPYYIRREDNQAFALAGLSDTWTDKESGEIIETISIITTRANTLLQRIHNTKKRMPVILNPDKEFSWLDSSLHKKDIQSLLEPYNDEELTGYQVNKEKFLHHTDPLDESILFEDNEDPEQENLFSGIY